MEIVEKIRQTRIDLKHLFEEYKKLNRKCDDDYCRCYDESCDSNCNSFVILEDCTRYSHNHKQL